MSRLLIGSFTPMGTAIFNLTSERSVICLENSRHTLSTNRLKPIVSWSRVYYSRSYWLLVMLTLVPKGHCDFSGFGFKTPNTNSFVVTK